ncbi:hypothetical protein Q2V63_29305, partial [Escherichia coli]|nr:hypothetical protein [Escherichia coli]
WQQVLTPAAESLNTRWRTAVVDGWNNAFSGRYPFKNVSSDASLPLLAYSALFDHGLAAFFKVVVAFCNKVTLCSLFFWIQVDF